MASYTNNVDQTTCLDLGNNLASTPAQHECGRLNRLNMGALNEAFKNNSVGRTANASQPLVGIIDTSFNFDVLKIQPSQFLLGCNRITDLKHDCENHTSMPANNQDDHGTHMLNVIVAENRNVSVWLGRAVGSGRWAESLVEFVDAVRLLGHSQAVVNLSFDLIQVTPDGCTTTRNGLTLQEQLALEYARQNGVLIVVAAGNTGQVMSALGQAAQWFDHIIPVGAAEGGSQAKYSSNGAGSMLFADGSTDDLKGTSIAAARVTGSISQIWAVNPDLSYRQVIDILHTTAQGLRQSAGSDTLEPKLLDSDAASSLAIRTLPISYKPKTTILPLPNQTIEGIPSERPAIWGRIKKAAKGAVGLATNGAQALGNAAINTAQVIGNTAVDGAQIVGNAAIDSVQTVQNTAIDVVQVGIGAVGGDAINQAIDDAQSTVNGVVNTVQSAQNTLVDSAQSVENVIVDFVQGASNQGFDLVQEATNTDGGGTDWLTPVKEGAAWAVDKAGDGAVWFEDQLGDGTAWGLDKVGDGADWGLSKIGLDGAGEVVNTVFDKAGNIADAAIDEAGLIANGVLDSIAQGPAAFADKAGDKLLGILDRGASVVTQSPDRLKQLGSDSLDLITSLGTLDLEGAVAAGGRMVVDAVDLAGIPEIAETAADIIKFNTRTLTDQEIQVAKSVFGDSINYDLVRIDESARSVVAARELDNAVDNRPFTTFHTINTWGPLNNESTLIHELTHVWQYEQDGAIYITEALQAQHSDAGYGYGGVAGLEKQLANGGGLTDFNREQQGDVLEQYYELRTDGKTDGKTEHETISDSGVLPLFEFFVREASTVIQPTSASSHTTLNSTSNNLVLTGTDATNGTGNSLNNVIMGNNAANNLNGLDGRDWLYGSGGTDKLYGMDGNDFLSGGTADDMLSGWTGDDQLVGGAGEDTLLGGAGKDTFTFYAAHEGVDRILDFSVTEDQIRITKAGFSQDLSVGALPADQFVLGASASGSNDRLIYNPSTGALFFDADGNNGQQQTQIAQLSPNLTLTASQISIV
jgi:hypothetical protein